jgi:hypothetical protein
MSKIALSGNASGTGTFTIASPNSNSDRTLTLPDAGGTVFVSGQALSATTGSFSGDVTLGSSVLATPTGSAPSYTCRAWVNVDCASNPNVIRASGNISSLTRVSSGVYDVNFTTAMSDANYAVTSSIGQASGRSFSLNRTSVASSTRFAPTTASFRFVTQVDSSTSDNMDDVHLAVFR